MVKKVNRAPVMTAIPATTTDWGKLVTLVVNATDPDGDKLVYSATGLPANATFDAGNRTFAWTPVSTQIGNYTVTFRASDGVLSDSKNATITVKKVNRAPVMTAIPANTVDEGKLLSITVSASDPDGDTLSYSATNLPSGAVFNAATRSFSWTPGYTQAGNYTVTFRASDGALSGTKTATITVRNVILNAPIQTTIQAPSNYYIMLE
jgi:PKD repeat protein